MKKYLIISFLAFLPLLIFAHTADSIWVSGYIIDIDTFAMDSASSSAIHQLKLTNCFDQLENINSGFIDTKSNCSVGGWKANRIYSNANNADTTFYLMEQHVLNSDSTELYPYRLSKVYIYNSAVIGAERLDIYNVFGVHEFVDFTLVDINGSGDFTSLFSALTASSNGDTILIKSGEYIETLGTFYNRNQMYLQGIGNCTLKTSSAQSPTLNMRGDNNEVRNIKFDGQDANAYAVYINLRDDNIHQYNEYTGHTHRVFNITGDVLDNDSATIKNNVFNSNLSVYTIEYANINIITEENYFTGNSPGVLRDGNLNVANEFTNEFKWNKSTVTYSNSSGSVMFLGTRYNNLKYNEITADSLNLFINHSLDTFHANIIGNYWHTKNNIETTEQGFLANIETEVVHWDIRNNNVVIDTGISKVLNLYLHYPTSITGNTFEMLSGAVVFLRTPESVKPQEFTNVFSGNTVSVRAPFDNGSNSGISLEDEVLETIFEGTWVVDSNKVYGGFYFNHEFGGHGGIYLHNTRNRKLRWNYLTGHQVAGIIDKGITSTDEGVICGFSDIGYNIFDSCNIVIKGVSKDFIHNNVFTYGTDDIISIATNVDYGASERADSNMIYNNIIYKPNVDSKSWINLRSQQDSTGFECDYNLVYGNDSAIFNSTIYSWAEWQALGYDNNSYNSDPLLDSDFIPQAGSDAIGNGINLGTHYNKGLNISSSWPDNVTLRKQLYKWSIGAYVTDLPSVLWIVNYNGSLGKL